MESMILKKAKQAPAPPSPTADPDSSGDDRISALGDDLRGHILRNLNVRDLVRTSVLSKRWRGLWKRVPVLDFFGWPKLKSAGDVSQYIAIVNDVLQQRAGATSEARIDEVNIPLLLDVHALYGQRWQLLTAAVKAAEAWIWYAMHHQVKGFWFNLNVLPGYDRPRVKDLDELLPSSPRLERMRLGLMCSAVRFPRTAVFTSLKELTLEFVKLAAGSGHLLARLSSSVCCPTLQKLQMMHVNFDSAGTKELVLDAGKLLELSMESVSDMVLLELRTPKLLYLKIKGCMDLKSLTVSAPGLKELTYSFNRPGGLVRGPLPCVWRLKIDLITHMEEEEEDDDKDDENSSSICLLKCCSSVRCLLVHLYVPLEEERHVDLIKDKIPQLPNITSLWVSIAVTCQRHSFGDGVASLLTRFKNLDFLSLQLDHFGRAKMDEYYSEDVDGDQYYYSEDADGDEYYSEDADGDEYYSEDADGDLVFICNHADHWESNSSDISLGNLREACFRGLTGTGCELRFLQMVLKSAIGLERVTVNFSNNYNLQDSRMRYFLHMLLKDGTWTVCQGDYDQSYQWTPLHES